MSIKRKPSFFIALIPLLAVIISAALSIVVWKSGMLIPLVVGIAAASILAFYLGYKWIEIEKYMVEGVKPILVVVFMLLLVGAVVGTWIIGGVIPTLIVFGLDLIQPSIFLPTVVLISGILTLFFGSSFVTIATVGIAFMAVGHGVGFPAPVIAAAVICGGLFGDKLSPLCDTTVTTPVIVDTDLYSHIKHMMWDTIPAYLISIIIFWFIGNRYTDSSINLEQINTLINTLEGNFNIQPLLLLLPVITIILMVKKCPVIPTLFLLVVLGGIASIMFQGSTISQVVQAATHGYTGNTGDEILDSLLSQGGITSMSGIILLAVCATALGGIFEGAGLFKALLESLIKRVKSSSSLIMASVFSAFLIAFSTGALYLAIILPGRALMGTYKELGIDTKNLSRCLEAVGSVGIALVPWSVSAIYYGSVLGVSPYEFIPYLFFSFLVPIINIIFGLLGVTIAKKDYPETINLSETNTTYKSINM